jgi:hypothetical protein
MRWPWQRRRTDPPGHVWVTIGDRDGRELAPRQRVPMTLGPPDQWGMPTVQAAEEARFDVPAGSTVFYILIARTEKEAAWRWQPVGAPGGEIFDAPGYYHVSGIDLRFEPFDHEVPSARALAQLRVRDHKEEGNDDGR